MRKPTEPWVLLLSKGVLLLWFVYLLLGPTVGFGWIDSWHNEQRAVQVVLLCVTALAFSLLVAAGRAARILRNRGMALIAAFIGLGVVSSAMAQRPYAAIAEVSTFSLLFALAAMTSVLASSDKETAARWANYAALFLATVYVLGVLVRLAAALELGYGVDLNVLILGYANPRFPTAFHTVLIPFVAAVASQREEPRLLRVSAVVVLTLLWAINWGLGTRGIWFAYLGAVPAAIALLGWSNVKQLSALLLGTAAVGIALFVLLAPLAGPGIEPLYSPTQNLTLTSREVLWELAWRAIESAPLLGIGPMHFVNYGRHVERLRVFAVTQERYREAEQQILRRIGREGERADTLRERLRVMRQFD